jgi:hypothetical protein
MRKPQGAVQEPREAAVALLEQALLLAYANGLTARDVASLTNGVWDREIFSRQAVDQTEVLHSLLAAWRQTCEAKGVDWVTMLLCEVT